MTDGEIIVHQLDGRALPQRRARRAMEPVDARSMRTIAAALMIRKGAGVGAALTAQRREKGWI